MGIVLPFFSNSDAVSGSARPPLYLAAFKKLVCTPCQLAAGGYRVAGECDAASSSFRSSLPLRRLKSGGALHLQASRYIDGNTVLGTRAPRRLPDS